MIFTYPTSRRQIQNQLLTLVLLALVGWAFFIDKPIYNDDVTYLEFSERFADVKSFYTTPFYLFGKKFENVIDGSHPPLTAYLNYLVYKAYPEAEEIAFHSVYYLFAAGAIAFTYLFSLRFSNYPFLVALGFLFSPPFFIQAQSLMTDIVLHCFIFGSLFFFVKAVDLENRTCLFWAVLMFSLALGAGFQAMVFYAAFFTYACVRSPRKPSYFIIMFLALVPSLIWFAYHFSFVNQAPNPFYHSYFDWTYKRAKIIYYISQLSLAYLCPLGLILAVINRDHKKTVIVAGIFTWISYHFLRGNILDTYSFLQKWVLYGSGFFSLFGLALICRRGWKLFRENASAAKWDHLFLATLFFTYLIICIIFTQFGASRYLLPIMPFFLILILKESPSPRKAIAMTTIGLCVVVSFQVALAEYRFADFYRKFPKIADRHIKDKQRTWFVGYLGFRYYMKKAGYPELQLDSTPNQGDWIVEPTTLARLEVASIRHPNRQKKVLTVDQPGTRIKVLNYEAHAGFLGQHWGLLPFWPKNTPMDRIIIHEIMPPVIPFNLFGEQEGLAFSREIQPVIKPFGKESRESVLMDRENPLTISMTLRKTYRLQFGIGTVAASAPAAGEKSPELVRFKISVTSENTEKTAFEHSIAPGQKQTGGALHNAEIDLATYKDKPLKLTFETNNDPLNQNVEAFWTSLNLVEEGDFYAQ